LATVGVIDYPTGRVLVDVQFDDWLGEDFQIFVKTDDDDIPVTKNNILKIDPSQINLTIEQVAE
jgi:hypothetical protein